MARNATGRFVPSTPATPDTPGAPDTTTTDPATPAAPRWTDAELLGVRHLGPGIIGREMYDAAQRLLTTTAGGTLGPAITTHDDPAYYQGADKAQRFGLPAPAGV